MRPISGPAAAIEAAISLYFGVEMAHAVRSIDATRAKTTRPRMMVMIFPRRLDGQWYDWRHRRERALDGQIEARERALLDDDVALVDVRALERHDLIPCSVHLALWDRADELPSGAGAQGCRVA